MKKLKALLAVILPVLVILLLVIPASLAEEAENLTGDLKIKAVDKTGKTYALTDGKYATYWESSKRKDPYVTLTSDKPVYGLYLCFRTIPESYVIQKASGDSWTTVAEGDTRFYHVYYELDGLTKIRILSTAEKKNALAITELFAFGEGETPDWVQRWQPTEEKADVMFIVAHPDDELIFLGGAIPYYACELNRRTVVAYLTPANYPNRRSEALNGLWSMGIRNYPVFGPFSDHYAKTGKLKDAYNETKGGKQAVWGWMTELFRKYQPEAVVTHDPEGEYGHPQHKMLADSATVCYDRAADPEQFPDSAAAYGTWQVKKLYLHLYGEESDQTVFDWFQPMASLGGRTGIQLAADAFQQHVSQVGHGVKVKGKYIEFNVEKTGVELYPNNRYGLYRSEVGPDEARNDFLEHLDTAAVYEEKKQAEPAQETEKEINTEEEEENTEEEETAAGIPDGTGEVTAADPADEAGSRSPVAPVPEWADAVLNERGYIDEGEYILEDAENGHWMYVSQTLRIQITRTWETPEKAKKSDATQTFNCYTAEIWCDVENGELPWTVWSDPEHPRKEKTEKVIRDIASQQRLVFATSTDYYTYRVSRARESKSNHVGVDIRNGETLYDDPQIKEMGMPNYETLALYRDGHVESYPSRDKRADEYLAEGAIQVYTFGPCIVRDGQFSEYIAKANRVLNPRHAFGMVEPGHYIDVICEGRLKKTNGSTGVMMETLAQIMLDRGCTIAVNLDGGQTAVMAFMGKQLNTVQKSVPYGRPTYEVLSFGSSDQVKAEE